MDETQETEWWTTDQRLAHERHHFADTARFPACRICAFEAALEPCLMCGEPSVPEGAGPLCEECEAGQDTEANREQA